MSAIGSLLMLVGCAAARRGRCAGVDDTRMSGLLFRTFPLAAVEYAARPGPCRKPLPALYTQSGGDVVLGEDFSPETDSDVLVEFAPEG
jgi:hypothetical protein